MAVQVSFESLKSNHFSHENFIGRLRGRIAAFLAGPPPQSTCATQISYALNGAGAMIEAYEYESPEVAGKKVRALQDDARRNYIYSVIDLKVYLNNRYGQAENYKGSKDEMIAKIRGRQGILAFGHSHIDLWLGDNIHYPSHYDLGYLWGTSRNSRGQVANASIPLRGIFFWPVA